MRPRSRRTWRRRLGALVVVVLIGDGAAGLAIHRDHQRAAAHPAAPAVGPPPGCSAVVLPPAPAVP
ncbi:MAG TPA: hypothetical protein VGI06_04115, partial [Acidimicrobiales bacterium]